VQGEVVEEDRALRDGQALDRLDEELIRGRRLEPARPEPDARVVVDVHEHVQKREGIEPVRERDTVAEWLAAPAAEDEPRAREVEGVMDRGLTALEVAAIFELGQVVELEDVLVILRTDLEARTELDVGPLAIQERRLVESGRGWRIGRQGLARSTGRAHRG